MGTWNTKLNGNDTFQDIYQDFFDLYNEGQNPSDISKLILDNFSENFNDSDERNNCLFGLILAQWETKSLDPIIFGQVKEIIESRKDIDVWKELGADEKTLKQRQAVLDKFLIQISTDREKPKRRVKSKFEFEMIDLVNIVAPDNLKTFNISEEYANKKYIHTSGMMMWEQGGGSVLYFTEQEKFITAKWLDKKTLEIIYDKSIIFDKKDESAYYMGEDIKIIYKEQ